MAPHRFLTPDLLELVHESQDLPGDPDEARPGATNRPVVLGHLGEETERLALEGEVSQLLAAAIGELGRDVEFPPGAAAIGLSAGAARVVDASAPEGGSFLGSTDEGGDLVGERSESLSEWAGVHLLVYIG